MRLNRLLPRTILAPCLVPCLAAAALAAPAAPSSGTSLGAALAGKTRLAAAVSQTTSTEALASLSARIRCIDGSEELVTFRQTGNGCSEARGALAVIRARIQNSVATGFEIEAARGGEAIESIVIGCRPSQIAFDAGCGEFVAETPGSSLGAPVALQGASARVAASVVVELLEPVRVGAEPAAGDLFGAIGLLFRSPLPTGARLSLAVDTDELR